MTAIVYFERRMTGECFVANVARCIASNTCENAWPMRIGATRDENERALLTGAVRLTRQTH